jgi:hypothetical protein
MPYIGRTPTFGKFAAGAVSHIISGDLKVTGLVSSNDTLSKMIIDTAADEFDNIIIEDGGTDGASINAGDDICLEKETNNIVSENGLTNQEKSNVMLNAFLIAVNGGLAQYEMIDGIVDEFEDESGTNDDNLVNEVYDTTSDFYQPSKLSLLNPQGTGTYISWSDYNSTYNAAKLNDGDPDTFWFGDNFSGSKGVTWDAGSGNSIDPTQVRLKQSHDTTGCTRLDIDYSDNGSSFTQAHTTSTTSECQAGDFTHTFSSAGAHRYWRLEQHRSGGTRFGAYVVDFSGASDPKDMVIQSDSFTALVVPTSSFVTIWHEPVDVVTINTDFQCFVSRDGGSNFTQVTLVKGSGISTGNILTGLVDISGQPSGTSMQYQLKTFNGKDQKINAVSMEWRI